MPAVLRVVVIGLALSCVAQVRLALATTPDGYYDTTWAGGGRISFAGDPANPTVSISTAPQVRVLIENNGNVLLAGSLNVSGGRWWLGELSGGGQYVGEFVPTFGLSDGSGRVTACDLGFSCLTDDYLYSVVEQPDGKYVLASTSHIWRTLAHAAAFDTAGVSGGTGYVSNVFTVNDVMGTVNTSLALALLPNGKILAGGFGYYSAVSSTPIFGVVRLNSDLSLDTTFNAMVDGHGVTFAGGALIAVSEADPQEKVRAILLQTDGRIVLVGYAFGSGFEFEAARLNADGTLDTSYGSSGTTALLWPGGSLELPESMAAIDGADRVLVPFTGTTNAPVTSSMLVLRLGPDGLPDATFNGSGFAVNTNTDTCSSGVSGASLALDSAGRIVVVGSCFGYNETSNRAFAVERLRGDNGALDTSFGISGWGFGYFSASNTINDAGAIAFDQGGRPIIVGTTQLASGVEDGGASRVTYDLIRTNNFENVPRGCLPPDCN